MNPQLAGIETIPGTYVFDLRVSNRTLALNRFLWELRTPEARERFWQDEEAAMQQAGLSADECGLVRDRDWIGLVRHGANFFVLEKLARVVRKSNMEVYAEMRGESFESFLATRQVPGAR